MFCRMLAKNAGAPGILVRELRVKRGDSLHSRASLVAASTPVRCAFTVGGKNLVFEGDLISVNGVVSIKDGTSINEAKPPIINYWIEGVLPIRPYVVRPNPASTNFAANVTNG
jgi:hypothetical protein